MTEVKTDLEFLTVVQVALPPLVGLAFALLLVEPARALNLPIARLWPRGWPIWLQAVLMILVVDLLRYWLHRAAHENDTLWKLHSVHHSVEQLYWLNTARFHPLEKTLQMTLDSLPFLLMGVDGRVLALYYLAYSTNGFFQHCNIDVRYGVLNYIVGSAETHRWHHSRIPRESNANYGNTVRGRLNSQGVTFGGAPFILVINPSKVPGFVTDQKNPQVVKFADVSDGMSTTLMFSETVQGKGGDLRGFGWWGGGSHFETMITPNSPLPDRTEQSCTPTVKLNPPCVNRVVGDPNLEETIAARSRHPTGVHAAMCDGSTHFVSNNIDLVTWRALGTAAGGDPVGSY
jgi:hypothetical protein